MWRTHSVEAGDDQSRLRRGVPPHGAFFRYARADLPAFFGVCLMEARLDPPYKANKNGDFAFFHLREWECGDCMRGLNSKLLLPGASNTSGIHASDFFLVYKHANQACTKMSLKVQFARTVS